MIQLDKYEKLTINLIVGNLQEKYPFTGNWCNTLKPLFEDIYCWNTGDYHQHLVVMFDNLLDLYLKIIDDESNSKLKKIFFSSFSKGIIYDQELPVERAINNICGLIQCVKHSDNGKLRFEIK